MILQGIGNQTIEGLWGTYMSFYLSDMFAGDYYQDSINKINKDSPLRKWSMIYYWDWFLSLSSKLRFCVPDIFGAYQQF